MMNMTEKEKIFQNLLIDGLLEMNLPKENVCAIASMLKTEEQMRNMLIWIKNHYKENPIKLRVMLVAVRLKEYIDAELTDSLIKGIGLISNNLNLMSEVVMAMKSETQIKSMTDWLQNHQKEHISEDEVLEVAESISEQVS